MYPLLIGAALGLTVMIPMLVIPKDPFFISGPFLGLLTLIATFVLISRRISTKIAPFIEAAQRQVKSGNVKQAVESFEKALAWKKWQVSLEQQINTQIGTLHYAGGDEPKAAEFLREGYPKVSEGHLVLAAILYREGKKQEAYDALDLGIRFNKKSAILYNVLAWMLHKDGKRDEALAILEKGLKKLKTDEDTSTNIERLREDKKLNMKPFGQHWFMLKFETPKGMGQTQPFRKGFRQAPKNKGKQRKAKKR